jgi:hypothetical protein
MSTPAIDVAIVGAGFSGIAMARALDQAGIGDYLLLEKADEVGGTWRENVYPGAACDVPSHLYSLSDAPRSTWTRLFPQQPEILAYLRELAAPLKASGRLRLGACLQRAQWVGEIACWELEFGDGRTSGAGAVAGAVIGGVLGSQVGSGRGRDAATIAGAIAGGAAGNRIEGERNARDTYAVYVRMDDGRRLVFEQRQLDGIREGARVTVRNGRAHLI